MKIMQSGMALQSAHDYSVSYEQRESLVVRRQADATTESPTTQKSAKPTETQAAGASTPDALDTFKARLLEMLLEKLTGKSFHFISLDPSDLEGDKDFNGRLEDLKNANPPQSPQKVRENWGYRYDEVYREKESTAFSAEGTVKTADGKEISFNVSLKMSREFVQENHVQVGNLTDPLVINFSGKAAELTQNKFRFDLDSNGEEDQISFLKPGSGFLALDKNENGKIDDGSELFGPKSGDGFSDLSALDEDKNGWIDENDKAYSKLRIWSKDEGGKDNLIGLGQAGVGAIYLGHVGTPFSLKDERGDWMGQVRESGVFLKENGEAGTVQQIDLSL